MSRMWSKRAEIQLGGLGRKEDDAPALRVRGLCVDRLAFTLLKYGYVTDVIAWAYTYVIEEPPRRRLDQPAPSQEGADGG
jgi:hypothetical protein